MPVSKHQILRALALIETREPLYAGDLPLPDARLREIFADAMAALSGSAEFADASARSREASLLASLAHALLEVACLRHRLAGFDERAADEAAAVCARFRRVH